MKAGLFASSLEQDLVGGQHLGDILFKVAWKFLKRAAVRGKAPLFDWDFFQNLIQWKQETHVTLIILWNAFFCSCYWLVLPTIIIAICEWRVFHWLFLTIFISYVYSSLSPWFYINKKQIVYFYMFSSFRFKIVHVQT